MFDRTTNLVYLTIRLGASDFYEVIVYENKACTNELLTRKNREQVI